MKPNGDLVVIDRIEGDFAVAEVGGKMTDIPLAQLPAGVKEGSVLRCVDGCYVIDQAAEQERQTALFNKQKSLFKRK